MAKLLRPQPSRNAQAMAEGDSDANNALAKLRNAAPWWGWAAAKFSGAFGSATGFPQLAAQGGFDIFQSAASNQPVGQSPYNNWLTSDVRPAVTVFPKSIGFYVGAFGADTQDVVQALVENAVLQIVLDNTPVVIQPLLTLQPGVGIDRKPATTAPNTAMVTERFGDLVPIGQFQLPTGTRWDRARQLKALLQVSTPALAYLTGLTGSFPTAGSIMAVSLRGTIALRIGTQR